MEQRRHDRESSAAPAILRVEGAGSYLVTILDYSTSGLRVSCSAQIRSDANVSVICRGATAHGIARYARPVRADEFHVGIEATGGSPQLLNEAGELDVTLMFRPRRKS